jgi:hypothetical protein
LQIINPEWRRINKGEPRAEGPEHPGSLGKVNYHPWVKINISLKFADNYAVV